MDPETISSGLRGLDEVVQGLRLGDNVVWQVDDLEDYLYFAESFAGQAIADGRDCVYLRFAPHEAVLQPQPGLVIIEVDPSAGFDVFSSQVHSIIKGRGRGVFYVFDNLSALVEEWATDELLANFFQVTCPYLFELDTVTYFALTRGQHAHGAVARIRDTTQILIDVYSANDDTYIHPIKVWDRYSPEMFLPHAVSGERWTAVDQSGDAAALYEAARTRLSGESGRSVAPWDSVYARLLQHRRTVESEAEDSPELAALKRELCGMMIGAHPDFSRLAEKHLTLDDLTGIRDRLIGSGRIGGKAAGMLLARRILLSEKPEDGTDFAQVLENHDSFYVGSDVFFTFLVNNNLFRLRLRLSQESDISREEFEEVERRFLAGTFPPAIKEQFRSMLDYFGQAPVIVRSSSLLEDSFGNAFAGKYRSEFCANQGSPDERLEALLAAVKLVYASALNPDALSYRRKRGLGDRDEQMAILIQRVAGARHNGYFYPTIAGVAFSRNLYAWTDRIDPKQGMIRLVFGLGTRAVDRVGGDYPRMIAVSSPTLRPEAGSKVARYSQRHVDLLDLPGNRFTTVPLREVLFDRGHPNLHMLVSTLKDGHLSDPITKLVDGRPDTIVLTFNNLIKRSTFVKTVGEMVSRLEQAYGHPVDTEFTASVDDHGGISLNLLQCRPLLVPGASGQVTLPENLSAEKVLFESERVIGGGTVEEIRRIVYIDPRRYAAADAETKKRMGRLVGRINEHLNLAEEKVVMIGPGRWGSSNIDLGVNAAYAEISNAAALVEVAYEEAGHVPEVSYGTHFFQDLVESDIIYLAVYPDASGGKFNSDFFESAPNSLVDLLGDVDGLEQYVKLIDVPLAAGVSCARMAADAQRRRGICYLE